MDERSPPGASLVCARPARQSRWSSRRMPLASACVRLLPLLLADVRALLLAAACVRVLVLLLPPPPLAIRLRRVAS